MALTKPFYAVLEALKARIEADPDVSAFCQERYDKELAVLLHLRPRKEVRASEAPLLMVTAPGHKTEDKPGLRGRESRKVLLYLILHQQDRDKAFEEISKLEELLDQALQRCGSFGGLITDIKTGEGSATDEGVHHPFHALVKAITITRNVNQTAR